MMCEEAEVEKPVKAGVLTGYLHSQAVNRTSVTHAKIPVSPATVVADRDLWSRAPVLDGEDVALLKRERKLSGIVREQTRVLKKATSRQVHLCHTLKVTTCCLYLFRGTGL
jgi:hypothetical protein